MQARELVLTLLQNSKKIKIKKGVINNGRSGSAR
jgi:hypothetical protein